MQVCFAHSHTLIQVIHDIKLNTNSGRPINLPPLYEINTAGNY